LEPWGRSLEGNIEGHDSISAASEKSNELTIPIQRSCANSFPTVTQEHLSVLLCETVAFAFADIDMIEVVLHVIEQGRIGAIHDDQTLE
jgi:hypothetical protein